MTNKNKEHCEVLNVTQRTSIMWKESNSSSSLSISHLCCPTVLLSTPVPTSWPWTGPAVAQQCLSLARGVCTLTSLKIPEDRFRTRVSDRLPWKDLGQTSKDSKQRKVQQRYSTHIAPFPLACTIGKGLPTQRKKES
jgi:hypothetical protein